MRGIDPPSENGAMTGESADPRSDYRGWVKATTYGWWFGFLLIVLLVLSGEALLGGEDLQSWIGLGMGGGVGYLQGRYLNRRLDTQHGWFWTSVVGVGGPFVLGDVARMIGLDVPYSLPLYVVIGSLLAAILQWRVLRRHSSRAIRWLPVCVAGWSLPILLIALKDGGVVPGAAGQALSLVGMFLGGSLLGLVTGGVLGQILRPAAVERI